MKCLTDKLTKKKKTFSHIKGESHKKQTKTKKGQYFTAKIIFCITKIKPIFRAINVVCLVKQLKNQKRFMYL